MSKDVIDIPVALIFFNRPKQLKITFEAIRKAKPSKLFLIQDGPRENSENDLMNILKCREIVENIDWDCEIYKNYSDINLKTGFRIYSGISWCFEFVDRLCIVEDDCVPSLDFFLFAKEILEKYKDDKRIDMISGMNNLGTVDTKNSYLFAKTGSIWGWATWKRVWDTVEYNMDFMQDEETMKLVKNIIKPKRLGKQIMEEGIAKYKLLQNGEKLSSWSYQRGMNMYLNSSLIIVPRVNLISNIGLTDDSVHAVNSIRKIPKRKQRLFFMDVEKMQFPLSHPKYVVQDVMFDKKVTNLMRPPYFIQILQKIESKIRRIIFK